MEKERNVEQQKQLMDYPELMIFDMDGTLIINPSFYIKTYSGTLEQTILEERGQIGLDVLKYCREEREGKGELALEMLDIPFSKWAERLNLAPIDNIAPNPELVAKLRAIPSKKVLFTGSPKILAYRLLAQVGFDPEKDFELIIGWEEPEISPRKWECSSMIFREICDRMGIIPQNTWSIGDNWESDLDPAQKIGAKTFQINKSTGNPDYRFATVTLMTDAVEQKRNKPYVVSGDIQITLMDWAKRNGFILPSVKFFDGLRSKFETYMKTIFPNFEFVTEAEFIKGLQSLTSQDPNPIISLDGNYFSSQYRLDITRLVDKQQKNKGLGRRNGSNLLRQQFALLDELKKQDITEVSILDDVGFTGDMLVRVIQILRSRGFTINNVYFGIGMKDAIDKLQKIGCTVSTVREYSDVIDEICERDFYPGVPQSGRSINTLDNRGLPYLLPFGNPIEWASIPPEKALKFSIFCLDQTIQLFAAIEQASGRIVRCCDIERLPLGIPNDKTRYIDVLQKAKDSLQ